MKGNTTAEQNQVQQLSQGPGGSDAAAERQRIWQSLDVCLLPLIGFRLQETEPRSLGSARLACRQWAAELPQGCTRLRVIGKGREGWQHRFCGLEELIWVMPRHVRQSSWPKLRSLQIVRCKDGDLRVLRDLPGLTSLELFDCTNVTDMGLKELKHVSKLASLSLESCVGEFADRCLYLDLSSCCKITDAGLKDLGHMSDLTSLNLTNCCKITDAGLKDLGHMPNLTSLNLSFCRDITDEGLKVLGHMSNLTDLNLGYCYRITDAGLTMLFSHMPTLTSIDLSSCRNISDAGLKDLGHMSSLTTLNLSQCTNISDVGRRELIGQLANLTLS